MKHKVGYNPLGRKTAHRKAMTRNMLTSFFRHERIKTTKAKALAVRRRAEKMITRSRLDSVHNRRMIGRDIKDQAVLAKLFTEIGPRYLERPGGYTRVLKLGPRPSDAAEMVILELVSEEAPVKDSKKKKKKKSDTASATSKTAAEKSAAPGKQAASDVPEKTADPESAEKPEPVAEEKAPAEDEEVAAEKVAAEKEDESGESEPEKG
jgi:large subunit ribosomal protein L17